MPLNGRATAEPGGAQVASGEHTAIDERALDLLLETMDAWEVAVTRRMRAAIDEAVRAARSDVMQVRGLASMFQSHRSAFSCAVYSTVPLPSLLGLLA